MLNLQGILFLLMIAGVYARKRSFITPESRKKLTALFINLILPCNIVASFHIRLSAQVIASAGEILAISFGVQMLSWLLSKLLYRRVSHNKQMVLRYGTICSNSGFMGNPVVEGVYGMEGLLYASLFLIPVRIFMWSAGLSLFTVADKKDILKKLLRHPCIIAVWIGLGLMLIDFRLPKFVLDSISSISVCTTAVAMIIIGAILAEVDVRRAINRLTVYYSFVRLIFIPLLVLGVLLLLHVSTMLTGIAVLLAGMPAGSTTAILAEQYDGDAAYASQCVLLSTVFSLVTLPALSWLVSVL
ncbi:AEC family transporter [Ethanoligenens sp.]|uniref:AEC family transporter n=1 Tax=Ethanoligenens sp. TaxID=2099655 RepID=UPI0039EC7E2D